MDPCTGLLVCLMLAGAWLGYWVVPKHVLTQEGSSDSSTAVFVAWSIRSCHDYSAITLNSWHLMVTISTLHVARRFNVFETKAIDTETVMLWYPKWRVYWPSQFMSWVQFHWILPDDETCSNTLTVLSETLFLNKVSLSVVQVCISNCICFVNVLLKLCLSHGLSKFILL
ncbi:uncharacterized protein LOC113286942 [Papaver somniferum]|uniref:uncharacterized protein LOC113286942 n=1 Tax=Papaver somniferum TaxID=3469 RepID=UPI000E6F84F8|nr:uncharacterized protein LOC113286938 isoform X2 [Papaver somniferum]XP_026391373.1 uncharacterized protein LOC113286940 isoform X2 [Papaver somniferum]XP_026391377.1 uncharacterized protein LOC113286941 isoform X2 [Papaver somniferum]XP_026391378.1 uncharacterized protein LOC113286942 [Papaver somniferum]XP_026391379.1 uncharacterized protein LOC113286942 [Papaver somniferum]